MLTEPAALPGIFFEAPTPAPEETLPRMDIAAFVGFASSGPLHHPVAVESPRRFRELFGADPVLAWDDERGVFRRAHLGGAVEAFFANGGTRCWVVRVADATVARHHLFAVPALIDAATRAAVPEVVRARARAAGSWCEDLAVGTALHRDPLPLQAGGEGGSVALAPGGYRVDLAAGRSRLDAGDLLEIGFGPGAPVLLLFADRVVAIPGGLRAESAAWMPGGATEGAFWVLPDARETEPPAPLDEAAGIAAAQAALAAGPQTLPTVRRLRFELLVWKGGELHRALSDLAFGSRHPRFWAALPTDEQLFPLSLAQPGAEPQGLAREAASPRFPLAGPAGEPAPYYLPWGMGRSRAAEGALGLPADDTSGSTALERSGLAAFGAALFVDDHLARMGAGALLGEAEHRFYVEQRPLAGVHSLVPVDEVSLVAVPDAVHRGWSRELPPERASLGAPTLAPIPPADAAGRYRLTWSEVDGAEGYVVQRDADPAFPAPVGVAELFLPEEGETPEPPAVALSLPPHCPREVWVRVRAFRGGEVGPWSNTRGAVLPPEPFVPCEARTPPALTLAFAGDGASHGPGLQWDTEDADLTLPERWEIQGAAVPGFATAEEFAPAGMTAGYAPLPERRTAARFYRIRALRGDHPGPWSNTVRVGATERAAFTETAGAAFEADALLAVHRALLRFAAARGNLLALLSLPDHYREADALEHTGRLTPGGPEVEPSPPAAPGPRVAPLTESEAPVLSFGALYHPWTVARSGGDGDAPLRRLPPDGAVAGMMAALALGGGAWRAPANRPLTGVVALDPDLRADAWGRLVGGGVNVVVNDARGFLTRSEDTLGGERALRRVHVRRLMILLRRLALREGERSVFEPHGPQLRRRVRHHFERLLGDLFRRGALAGTDPAEAFRVVVDETVNPPASVDRGHLVVELRVAPAAALARLTVRLVTAGAGRLAIEEG